jgi:hypothetical protein
MEQALVDFIREMDFAESTCACCGGGAGRWKQWHSQDTGYSICRRCVDRIKGRGMSDDEFQRIYGVEGVHYAPAQESV